MRGIVALEVQRLEQRLADRQITMTLTTSALDYLTDVGFDPVYGARPLKRAIQRELETSTAQGILRISRTVIQSSSMEVLMVWLFIRS